MTKKPAQLPPRPALAEQQILAVDYVGSPEHKVHRYWGGLPDAWENEDRAAHRPGKQLTTICRLVGEADRIRATDWIKAALRAGQFRYREADQDFPWQIWYRDEEGRLWIGQCVNSVAGHYKGWPATEGQIVEIFGAMAR